MVSKLHFPLLSLVLSFTTTSFVISPPGPELFHMTTMHDLLPLQSPLLSSTKFTISTLMFLGDFYTSTTSVASAVGQSVTTSSTDFSNKIFPTTPKAHSNSSEIFSYNFNLIFSEEIIQYSRTFALQVQTP